MLGVDTQYRAVSHDNYDGRKRAQQKNLGFYGGAWSAYPVYWITTIFTCWVGITEFSIRNCTVEWLSCFLSKENYTCSSSLLKGITLIIIIIIIKWSFKVWGKNSTFLILITIMTFVVNVQDSQVMCQSPIAS